jgi:3-hydroxybutyrate dehydrogenase
MAAARTEGDLESLAREAELDYLVGSVATPEGCTEIVEETRRRLGPIEILVNNAGIISRREREVWDLDPEVWHETMATNLHGPFELTRLVAGDMVERRYGRIVMVSSTAGQVGGAKNSAYCASKHALLGLMRSVAQDVGPFGVTCNAVCPGWVNTPMAQEAMEYRAKERGVTREASGINGEAVTIALGGLW